MWVSVRAGNRRYQRAAAGWAASRYHAEFDGVTPTQIRALPDLLDAIPVRGPKSRRRLPGSSSSEGYTVSRGLLVS